MMINPEFKVYIQYSKLLTIHDKKNSGDKKSRNYEARSTIIWTYIKSQRIDLDVFFESILLNDSLKHVALLPYLMSNNKR